MKKLNLIVIGLGLFAIQPLHGQPSTNLLTAARQQVEAAEAAPTKANIDAARAAVAKIPNASRSLRNAYTRRIDAAYKTGTPRPVEVTYGPELEGPAVMPQAGAPTPMMPTRAMSANDFDTQLRALETDVANLRRQWNAKVGTGFTGGYSAGEMTSGASYEAGNY